MPDREQQTTDARPIHPDLLERLLAAAFVTGAGIGAALTGLLVWAIRHV